MQKELTAAVRTVMMKLMMDFQFTFMLFFLNLLLDVNS